MSIQPPLYPLITQRDWNQWAAQTSVIVNDGSITGTKLRPSTAASVMGRAGNTAGAVGDIVATLDNTFLARRAGSLAFDKLLPADIPGPQVWVQPSSGRAGIQAAYDSFNGGPGAIIVAPGTLVLDSTPIIPRDRVSFSGCGMGVTNIQTVVPGVIPFELGGSYGSYQYMAFSDFTLIGLWNSMQSEGGDNDRGFFVNGIRRLRFDSVEVVYCRQMSISANYCDEILVKDCRIRYSARDGINLTGSRHCIVVNNYLSHGNDDAIAIHQTATAGNPPGEGHIIQGNVIEDFYGIKALGASKLVISGNTLRRVKGYGIYTTPDGVEGYSDQISFDISANSITDVINANKFGAGSVCIGIYIGNATKSYQEPVVGGATPDINYPELFYYLSNNAAAQNAGAQGINISGNTIVGFTLPAALYSTWGFGTAFTGGGMVDPDLTTGFKFSQTGIQVTGAILSLQIAANTISAVGTPIAVDTSMTAIKALFIASNQITRYSGYGVQLETSAVKYGRCRVDGNTFDADPYFESTHRTSPLDGTWDSSTDLPGAIDCVNWQGVSVSANSFRNLNRVTHAASSTIDYLGNTYALMPDSTDATGSFANGNKGVRGHDGLSDPSARLICEDSDPTSATYGHELSRQGALAGSGMPSAGYFIAGQFVKCTSVTEIGAVTVPPSKYMIFGWQRITTGNAHVLNTDWRELHGLTGN